MTPDTPKLAGLFKVDTVPPVYFVGVNGYMVRLTTADLVSPRRFSRRCFEQSAGRLSFPIVAPLQWVRLVNNLLRRHMVEHPEEKTPKAYLKNHPGAPPVRFPY